MFWWHLVVSGSQSVVVNQVFGQFSNWFQICNHLTSLTTKRFCHTKSLPCRVLTSYTMWIPENFLNRNLPRKKVQSVVESGGTIPQHHSTIVTGDDLPGCPVKIIPSIVLCNPFLYLSQSHGCRYLDWFEWSRFLMDFGKIRITQQGAEIFWKNIYYILPYIFIASNVYIIHTYTLYIHRCTEIEYLLSLSFIWGLV